MGIYNLKSLFCNVTKCWSKIADRCVRNKQKHFTNFFSQDRIECWSPTHSNRWLCKSCCDIVLEIISSSFLCLAFLFSSADCASFLLVCDAFLLANTWQCVHFLLQPPYQHHFWVLAEETSYFTRFYWDEEQGDTCNIVIFCKLIFWFSIR